MNGKRFTWQAVAPLPWIDEKRLLAETRSLDCTLTNEEKRRNSINLEVLLCHASHPLSREIYELEDEVGDAKGGARGQVEDDVPGGERRDERRDGSRQRRDVPARMPTPMKSMQDIDNNQVLAVCFKIPKPLERFVPPVLMPGADFRIRWWARLICPRAQAVARRPAPRTPRRARDAASVSSRGVPHGRRQRRARARRAPPSPGVRAGGRREPDAIRRTPGRREPDAVRRTPGRRAGVSSAAAAVSLPGAPRSADDDAGRRWDGPHGRIPAPSRAGWVSRAPPPARGGRGGGGRGGGNGNSFAALSNLPPRR